ncbi:hypothetical protein F4824DRAFT_38601 [Ustulina deusta]|nr:hypothetical protein F4824DRAFT_38601 [Ustulina deusta]
MRFLALSSLCSASRTSVISLDAPCPISTHFITCAPTSLPYLELHIYCVPCLSSSNITLPPTATSIHPHTYLANTRQQQLEHPARIGNAQHCYPLHYTTHSKWALDKPAFLPSPRMPHATFVLVRRYW